MNPSDLLKTEHRKQMEKFYGKDIHMSSGNYFRFNNVIDNDNIILLTTDIRKIKDKQVLVLNKNLGLYLMDWQVRKLSNRQKGINCYAVKLCRKYFRPYRFSIEFRNIDFDHRKFDDLYNIAYEQAKERITYKEGWNLNGKMSD